MASFRINRLSDKFRIDLRIFFKYYPLAYLSSFEDTIGFITYYCKDSHRRKAVVYDPDGADKKIVLRYPHDYRVEAYFKHKDLSVPYEPCYSSFVTHYEYLRLRIITLFKP